MFFTTALCGCFGTFGASDISLSLSPFGLRESRVLIHVVDALPLPLPPPNIPGDQIVGQAHASVSGVLLFLGDHLLFQDSFKNVRIVPTRKVDSKSYMPLKRIEFWQWRPRTPVGANPLGKEDFHQNERWGTVPQSQNVLQSPSRYIGLYLCDCCLQGVQKI